MIEETVLQVRVTAPECMELQLLNLKYTQVQFQVQVQEQVQGTNGPIVYHRMIVDS